MEYKYIIYWQKATKNEKKAGFKDRFIELPFSACFNGKSLKKHITVNSEKWFLLEPLKIKVYKL